MPTARAPLILPSGGVTPSLATPPAHAGPGAAVLGRATLGAAPWLGARSVIRADGHDIRIGESFRLGPRGTVHIAHDLYSTTIGDGVTAGENTVIHACIVGDSCHLGRDVVVLDGSEIAPGAALADGAVVFPRSRLEGGLLHAGQPAKPVRPLDPSELDALHTATRTIPDEPPDGGAPAPLPAQAARVFLAATARIEGPVTLAAGVGIWFGCALIATGPGIEIGEETNVQDNSVLRSEAVPLRIGPRSTIGHNVQITDATVGERSLVGIGAVLAPGTVVEDDVLVAAGARTEPGQRLAAGALYGGSPAAPLRPLDDRLRGIIAGTWPQYLAYAADFRAIQAEHADT
jgi:gamma-carbonic anhydrase